MAIMAEWGPKRWEVSQRKVLALQGLSYSYTQVADNNTSTEEKKTTNERGIELFPLSFTTTLHSGAGVDVRSEIESWKSLVTQVNYFYLNGQQLGPKLQLRKVGVSVDQLDDFGRMRVATLSFEFKEYDEDANGSTSPIKTTNTAVIKAATSTIKVGDYVKPIGQKYATGETIPEWVKQRSHKVSQIKANQNKVLLGNPDGINSWVYLSEVTLV